MRVDPLSSAARLYGRGEEVSMSTKLFDAILIGRGPVGLTMAAVFGQTGHNIAVVERHRDLYALPRAGHVDHEIVRLLQSVRAVDALLADSYPTTEYVWKNAEGELLLEFDWGAKGISGYNSDFMQFQPVFEADLNDRIAKNPLVSNFTGWEATGIQQTAEYVELTVQKTLVVSDDTRPIVTDESMTLRGRFLIAADGASSFVRRTLGIERDDLGFNERWLVVDARKKRDLAFDFDCGQICDPRRPTTVLPLGKRHRRWEWMMLPGETKEELEKPETAWRLLAEQHIGPDDVEIVRQLVYTFEARHAREWRRDRIFLMGDAAHTMPPFMGQGMCSGMRDAKNLSWKLDLVLRGVVDQSILDSYERERSPHTLDWTLISIEAGKLPCTVDQDAARDRDEKCRHGWRPPMPDFPQLVNGILHRDGAGKPTRSAGQLGLQGRVKHNGHVDLFDNIFSKRGFVIVSHAGDPRAVLNDRQINFLESLPTTFVYVGAPGSKGVDAIDIDGTYAEYFRSRGVDVVVNRPDFYVFGGAERLANLPSLVHDLIVQLKPLLPEVRGSAAVGRVG
jgi:2-polyprenyl-6-methoxyphenol hydroxylase-like FAD-dependent oxidoreductase